MSEQEYLEMAEDCKNRIASKNKELKKLKKNNKFMLQSLSEIRLACNNLLTTYTILDEMTKGTRRGESSICMRKINNFLQDIDISYSLLNEVEWDSEEMDVLTRLTISQLTD